MSVGFRLQSLITKNLYVLARGPQSRTQSTARTHPGRFQSLMQNPSSYRQRGGGGSWRLVLVFTGKSRTKTQTLETCTRNTFHWDVAVEFGRYHRLWGGFLYCCWTGDVIQVCRNSTGWAPPLPTTAQRQTRRRHRQETLGNLRVSQKVKYDLNWLHVHLSDFLWSHKLWALWWKRAVSRTQVFLCYLKKRVEKAESVILFQPECAEAWSLKNKESQPGLYFSCSHKSKTSCFLNNWIYTIQLRFGNVIRAVLCFSFSSPQHQMFLCLFCVFFVLCFCLFIQCVLSQSWPCPEVS